MLTAFGRFVRKIRIDTGCLLKDMADSLGVTSSYLSAVEMGKRKIPADWAEKISGIFQLDNESISELNVAVRESQQELQINLSNASKQQRDLAFAFARKLDGLDENEIKDIFSVFKKSGEEQ